MSEIAIEIHEYAAIELDSSVLTTTQSLDHERRITGKCHPLVKSPQHPHETDPLHQAQQLPCDMCEATIHVHLSLTAERDCPTRLVSQATELGETTTAAGHIALVSTLFIMESRSRA